MADSKKNQNENSRLMVYVRNDPIWGPGSAGFQYLRSDRLGIDQPRQRRQQFGNKVDIARQIGNAVPVKLGEVIGRSIVVHVNDIHNTVD